MNILNPLALLFGLLFVPIILLYLLRLQRREQPVSSTMLWKQAALDREANTLWQRLRRNLLLYLQLATLALFIFALVRPYLNIGGGLNGRLIVLLDASASMQATDVAPTRFDAALVEVRRLIDGLSEGDEMLLVQVDGSPRGLSGISNNRDELLSALALARPGLAAANWSAAIPLATAASNGNTTIVVISDGANADDLKLLGRATQYVPIGASGDNVAIGSVTLRRTQGGQAAFVRVNNNSQSDDEVMISVGDGQQVFDTRSLKIPAGQTAAFTVPQLPAGITSVRASIDKASHNTLVLDDVVHAVGANTSLRRALLVTRGNRFLEQALGALPNLQLTRAISLSAASGDRPYDVYILDSAYALPGEFPAGANVLVIGTTEIFTSSGLFTDTQFVKAENHPALSNVTWRAVNVQQAESLVAPTWLQPLVEARGGTLLWAGSNPGAGTGGGLNRVMVMPFELRRSDLPLQLAFPILLANSIDWLAPPQGLSVPASVNPGEVVGLPTGARITTPDGAVSTSDGRGFAATQSLGVYKVSLGELEGRFAVNFINSRESDVTPNPSLLIASGVAARVASGGGQTGQREIWPYVAAVSLILLLIEWWIYQRGVPSLRRKVQ